MTEAAATRRHRNSAAPRARRYAVLVVQPEGADKAEVARRMRAIADIALAAGRAAKAATGPVAAVSPWVTPEGALTDRAGDVDA